MVQSFFMRGFILFLTASNGEANQPQEKTNSTEGEIDEMVRQLIAMTQELRLLKAEEHGNVAYNENEDISSQNSPSLLVMAKEIKVEQKILELGEKLKKHLKTVLSENEMKKIDFE